MTPERLVARRALVALVAWLAATTSTSAAATLTIESPADDTLVLFDKLTLEGTASPNSGAGAGVRVSGAGIDVTTPVVGGQWSVSVPLPLGSTVLMASYGGVRASRLVTRGAGIGKQGQQLVRFVWNASALERLKDIARHTVAGVSPTGAQALADAVPPLVSVLFKAIYAGANVVEVAAAGADVHTIEMLGSIGVVYGDSPYDCGNTTKQETSQIFVGLYALSMRDTARWSPMKPQDPLDMRIQDVAHVLARAAAHELGHSLGFVGPNQGAPCAWMRGCEDMHNCPGLTKAFPTALRYDGGRFLMDPGDLTGNWYRLGEVSEDGRGVRSLSRFSAFDNAYLAIVHPLP